MRQWFMDHSCASKPWLMIFKHKASRPLSDLARDSLEFKTISYNKSTVTEHCMQDGRWKKHAEKKHRMVLLVQTSVQARWWGGRMGEALGKTQVKFKCANSQWTQSSILYTPNCLRENLLLISGWWSVQQYLPFGELKLLPGPHQTMAHHFSPFTWYWR